MLGLAKGYALANGLEERSEFVCGGFGNAELSRQINEQHQPKHYEIIEDESGFWAVITK